MVLTIRSFFVSACLLLSGIVYGQAPQPAPNAVRLTKYVLGVGDLDRSYAFYRALGMDLENPRGTLAKPNTLAEMLLKLVDVPPGTKFRNMMLKVPGAPFSLEVTEFSNMELHAAKPRIQDPGASLMVLKVTDANAAVMMAKKAGAESVSALTVKDPDGYYVQFVSAPARGANFVSVVQDAEKAASFYRDHFGFEVKTSTLSTGDSANLGVPKAKIRVAGATIPGTDVTWKFADFKGVERKFYSPRIPDPGAAALGLQVHDLDAAASAVKNAGGASITQGGSVALGAGKVGFIRDPSGILVELAQPR